MSPVTSTFLNTLQLKHFENQAYDTNNLMKQGHVKDSTKVCVWYNQWLRKKNT